MVAFGGLFAPALGVADPELVGVMDFETGVGGFSFCGWIDTETELEKGMSG